MCLNPKGIFYAYDGAAGARLRRPHLSIERDRFSSPLCHEFVRLNVMYLLPDNRRASSIWSVLWSAGV